MRSMGDRGRRTRELASLLNQVRNFMNEQTDNRLFEISAELNAIINDPAARTEHKKVALSCLNQIYQILYGLKTGMFE